VKKKIKNEKKKVQRKHKNVGVVKVVHRAQHAEEQQTITAEPQLKNKHQYNSILTDIHEEAPC
jgi:hypothetical protein